MTRLLRIGLTGGIASGKTTVAQRFKELGVPVVDADVAARSVVAPGEPAVSEVVTRFGSAILDAAGGLNRRELRNRVFADPSARRDLEAILHPRIRAEMERAVADAAGPYVVLAIPLLVETGAADRVDRVLVVDASEAIQLERLMSRDACSSEQAVAVLAAQATRRQRLAAADDVLENTAGIVELRQAVDVLHARYLELAGSLARQKTPDGT